MAPVLVLVLLTCNRRCRRKRPSPVPVRSGRQGEEEALCAVCGDGNSEEPNQILFCERCDLAVHQQCYGLKDKSIRPPRWQMASLGLTHADLEGGSNAAQCVLCPVRCGAFKRTTDGRDWAHLVCALWQPETSVIPGNICEAVAKVNRIPADRWHQACGVCSRRQGAVMRCAASHCKATFHPLCARRSVARPHWLRPGSGRSSRGQDQDVVVTALCRPPSPHFCR
ncbi:PHD-zinc-finger like domain-containing protein [Haematococcus lacustris]